MKFRSVFIALFVGCALPTLSRTTHSPAENISASAITPSTTEFSVKSSVAQAPTYLKIRILSPKERKVVLKEAKAFQSRILKTLTPDELRHAANQCLTLGWNDEALRYLGKLQKISPNTTVVKNVKLEIADITFNQGKLKEAARLYDEYSSLYPGDKEKAAYAKYKGILSHFYCMLESDRDQTGTLKTIALADSFLDTRSSLFKKYAADVRSIKGHCFTRLYEHDMHVFEYYLKKDSFKAANTRIASMRSKLLPHLPATEPALLECEYRVARAEKNNLKALEISQELENRFPGYSSTRLAHKPTATQKYVDRF